jgi:hypothetical protein
VRDEPPKLGTETCRTAIQDELERLEESAMYSAQIQFEASTTGRIIAGVLALASAGFGAILTTVNAAHRMNQAAAAANAYLEIQTAARQARLIDLPHQSIEEARATLAELTARRDEQNKTVEPPNRRAYRKGSKNISSGGQIYEVDARAPQSNQ